MFCNAVSHWLDQFLKRERSYESSAEWCEPGSILGQIDRALLYVVYILKLFLLVFLFFHFITLGMMQGNQSKENKLWMNWYFGESHCWEHIQCFSVFWRINIERCRSTWKTNTVHGLKMSVSFLSIPRTGWDLIWPPFNSKAWHSIFIRFRAFSGWETV